MMLPINIDKRILSKIKILLGVTICIAFIQACHLNSTDSKGEIWGFTQLSPERTGIDFRNDIQHNLATKENLFDFDYFYNGSGVAVVNVNNDEWPDLFFAANQGPNKLYLNKGNFEFEDITSTAGINANKSWSNGVTVTDINGDGYEDIYVTQGGPLASQRNNLLYINNGDLTFTESASQYGLDDQGISTHAAFFDYDKDGDMDCFVLNESVLYGWDPIAFHREHLETPQKFYPSFSHLYRNEGERFIDISVDAGINQPTFGLGLCISDINQDGYPDIYVANDYYIPDQLYINRKNGTFNDRIKTHVKQTAFYGMGVDIADIDGDGYQDIYVLDMASADHYRSKTLMASMDVEGFNLLVDQFYYVPQYMFNTLNISDGLGRYNNVAHLSGLAKTEWSWAGIIEDYDLDGGQDVIVTNGYRRYASDNDFRQKVNNTKREYNNNVPLKIKKHLYDQIPSESLPNMYFRNEGNLIFEEIGKNIGLETPTFSNGMVPCDLDLDGDLDLVINNLDQEAMIYMNNASESKHYLQLEFSEENLLATATIEYQGGKQKKEYKKVRGYRSTMSDIMTFGLGDVTEVDLLTVTWPDGKVLEKKNISANQRIKIEKSLAASEALNNVKALSQIAAIPAVALGIEYRHTENDYNDFGTEILLPQKQSTFGPTMAQTDLNGDGADDLYIGGAAGQTGSLYLSNANTYQKVAVDAFEQDANHEDVGATFLDVDQDGDQDLYVMSGGNEEPLGSEFYKDRIYLNDGGRFVLSQGILPQVENTSGGAVRKIDFDQDGDDDLLIGNRIVPQSYPIAARSYLLENIGGSFVDVSSEKIDDLSDEIINDIEVVDYNDDGLVDFVTVGEWAGIRFYKNVGGKFELDQSLTDYQELTGWWYSVSSRDINEDGRVDFVLGNVGENIKHSASSEKPFYVYANDFDDSGTLDIVLSKKSKGQLVPVRGKECSTEQMPFISEKMPTYDLFATSSMSEIYGSDKLKSAYIKDAQSFTSYILLSEGDTYRMKRLPTRAQAFPMRDALIYDINDDGRNDLILAGGIWNTEVETPRLDAGSGLVLINNGEGSFSYGECPQYCFYCPNEVSQMSVLTIDNKRYLIGLQNDAPLSLFELK